ncbi:MAG: zf-TFIIB domain-containing protein [Planctomycetes bacterium]|nr:zf-TFIIB domain-containing protein [Planctomycetota bacterium]
MNCPKCCGSMAPVAFRDVEVDRCDSCGGIWFDLMELERLAKTKGAEIIDSAARKMDTAAGPTTSAKTKCPHCTEPMIEMTVHGQPHIRFESCTVCHGAFLDAGELRDMKQLTLAEWLRSLLRRG